MKIPALSSHARARILFRFALVSTLFPLVSTAQWSDGRKANAVIGQTNFTSSFGATAADRLSHPNDIAVDPATGKIFVADATNNRVLRFRSAAGMTKGASAEAVFGQPDFTSNTAGTTQNQLNFPTGVCIDSAGRLWVADTLNNRVIRFDSASSLGNQPDADAVLGQANYTSDAAATSSSGMRGPRNIAMDYLGNLWVADTDNHRVLKFEDAAAKSNGDPADVVLGQPSFISLGNGTSDMAMNYPRGIATRRRVAVVGNTVLITVELWVSDGNNHRVLRFNNADNKSDGAAADGVLGQSDFDSSIAATTRSGLQTPRGLTLDGTDLWVADSGNSRVLRYANAFAKTDGGPADHVIGKPDFTTSGELFTQSSLGSPHGGAVDAGGDLLVADYEGNRVLRFSPGQYRPDNLVGNKANPATQRGDGIYNASAVGQKIKIRKKRKAAKAHFTCQNEGPSDEGFLFAAKRGNRKVKVKYFQLTGGRANVTAQITRGNYVTDIAYRSSIRFFAKARMTKRAGNRGKRPLFLQASSLSNGAADRVLAKIVLKPKP